MYLRPRHLHPCTVSTEALTNVLPRITLTQGASAALAQRRIGRRPRDAELALRRAVEMVDAAVASRAGAGVSLGCGIRERGGEREEGGEDEELHFVLS